VEETTVSTEDVEEEPNDDETNDDGIKEEVGMVLAVWVDVETGQTDSSIQHFFSSFHISRLDLEQLH